MSRIGKKPVVIPSNVSVTIDKDKGVVRVKGEKGELLVNYEPEYVDVSLENGHVIVKALGEEKGHRARWGLYRQLIQSAIRGVVEPYQKQLEVIGVGYNASVSGNVLRMALGFSHEVVFVLPPEIKCEVIQEKGKNTVIKLTSIDKYLVGEVAARIRALRPVNVYSGKGIKYVGEVVLMKEGKKAKK